MSLCKYSDGYSEVIFLEYRIPMQFLLNINFLSP
jgi:hypothetical protein